MTDTAWLVFCFILVLLMQAGFLCLESGQVRQKNSVNVAFKNVADFVITLLIFCLFGYGIMFGKSYNGLLGTDHFFMGSSGSSFEVSFFLFQSAFAATAITLTSGAVAERMKFSAYLVMILLVCCFIYPLFGHWAWAGIINPDNKGYLQALGFVDFAGSTVVHSLGGWTALAAAILLGPRMGRFHKDKSHVVVIHGSHYGLAMLGAFLLIIGWIGFNAGSAFSFSEAVPKIILNTLLAGSSSGALIILIRLRQGGIMDAMDVLNGVLAGLVAITASCNIVDAPSSVVIGIVGGFIYKAGKKILADRGIDDVIDVVPVHLGAGIWGTISVALFADLSLLSDHSSRLDLLAVQILGISVCAIFSFGVAYLVLFQLDKFYRIRVGNEQERVGLDVSQHGIADPLKVITQQIEQRIAQYGIVEDERSVYSASVESISNKYEHVIKAMEKHMESRQTELEHLRILSNNDALTDIANRRYYDLSIEREFKRAIRYQESLSLVLIDIDYFKQFNDTYGHFIGDNCLITITKLMKKSFKRDTDMIARIGGDEFAVVMPNTRENAARSLCQSFKLAVNDLKLININSPSTEKILTVSIGISTFDSKLKNMLDHTQLFIASDKNLYHSKELGRNCIV